MAKAQQALDYTVMLAPVTAATASRTASVDTRGADYASILVTLGAEANTNSTNVTLQLAESDTNGSFATFNSNFNLVIDNTAGVVVAYHVDLKGRKRYLQLTITPDTHTTNGVVIGSAVSVLDLENKNVAASSNADVVVVG